MVNCVWVWVARVSVCCRLCLRVCCFEPLGLPDCFVFVYCVTFDFVLYCCVALGFVFTARFVIDGFCDLFVGLLLTGTCIAY